MIRLLDIVLSGFALLVLLPFLIPVILILLLTGEGEVFYRQQRVGRGGRDFGLLKFATMLKNSPNIGAGLLTLKDDPRVLPFGKFLRKTKINELPQLVNVLLGDMSVIGPRPHARIHFEMFPEHVRRELVHVRPGLSGIGSIVFRNEDEHTSKPGRDPEAFYRDVISPYKGELELWYIRRRSVRLYLALVGLTVWVVLMPAGLNVRRIFSDLPPTPREISELDG